jgi:hypothetical protein
MNNQRYVRIITAYQAALDGRRPDTVNILDLIPSIYDAVPDTTNEEIVAALRWSAEQDIAKADKFERRFCKAANDA